MVTNSQIEELLHVVNYETIASAIVENFLEENVKPENWDWVVNFQEYWMANFIPLLKQEFQTTFSLHFETEEFQELLNALKEIADIQKKNILVKYNSVIPEIVVTVKDSMKIHSLKIIEEFEKHMPIKFD